MTLPGHPAGLMVWPVVSDRDDGIKVRAVCPAGHETVTTAPKDRVTWRGECHTDGCTHRIVARKVLDDPGTTSTPAPSDPPKPAKKIRKVAAYRGDSGRKPDDDQQPPAPGFDGAGKPDGGSGGGGDGGPSGVPADTAGGAGGPGSGLIDDGQRRPSVVQRARERSRQRRQARAAAVDDGKPWTIPGIYR